MSFMVGALQTPGVTRGAVRRLLTQGETNAREEDETSASIMNRTTRTVGTPATTTATRGSQLPYGEPIPVVARLAETVISVGAVGGGSTAQT